MCPNTCIAAALASEPVESSSLPEGCSLWDSAVLNDFVELQMSC